MRWNRAAIVLSLYLVFTSIKLVFETSIHFLICFSIMIFLGTVKIITGSLLTFYNAIFIIIQVVSSQESAWFDLFFSNLVCAVRKRILCIFVVVAYFCDYNVCRCKRKMDSKEFIWICLQKPTLLGEISHPGIHTKKSKSHTMNMKKTSKSIYIYHLTPHFIVLIYFP